MKTNYHMHTYRCKHAVGDDASYVKAAIAAGFDEIGFSDHTPWPFASGYQSSLRMEPFMLDDYVNSVKSLQQRYKDRISIKIGLECEYYESYIPWLTDTVAKKGIDYLIFGHHFSASEEDSSRQYFGYDCDTPERLREYADSAVAGINSGIFSCFAHPDLFMRSYPQFDEHARRISHELCRAAAAMDLPLEYNLSGYEFLKNSKTGLCFPSPEFWRIAAEYGLKAIIGYDCHQYTSMLNQESYDRAVNELNQLGIERIDRMPLLTD